MPRSSNSRKRVVVVGGGGYGAAIARGLSAKLDASRAELTLVTARDFYIHLPAMLRTIVTSEGALEERALMSYDNLFNKGIGTVKIGRVIGITKNPDGKSGTVSLESGESIPWDVLVLVPGNVWEGGLAFPDSRVGAVKTIQDWRGKFKAADKIVLVGGGAVGIELSGELRDVYPRKTITIVHGEDQLLNPVYPDKFRADVERRLKKRHINIKKSTFVDAIPAPGEGPLETRGGGTIEADLVVPTRGGKPNTEFVESLGGSPRTASGHIKIHPTFQLEKETNILADGDAVDLKEQKQLGKSGGHVSVMVANVVSLVQGQPPKKKYATAMEGIFITNGKTSGAAYVSLMGGMTFGDKVVPMVKGKGLFIDMIRKSLGFTS